MSTHEANDDDADARPERMRRTGRAHKGRGGHGLITRVAGDTLSVRRVFGEPVVTGEVTLVPVAKVVGGSGSGYGTGELGGGADGMATRGEGVAGGGGGGFGARVKPVGAYVIRGSDVQWQPALDLSRVILGGQVVGAVAVLALAWALRRRR